VQNDYETRPSLYIHVKMEEFDIFDCESDLETHQWFNYGIPNFQTMGLYALNAHNI
jgi:hypothetical protein